jgi:hypothetical protein
MPTKPRQPRGFVHFRVQELPARTAGAYFFFGR